MAAEAPVRWRARVAATRGELDALRRQIVDWLARCHDDDSDEQQHYVGRYQTQREAIESLLLGVADALQQSLPDGAAAADAGRFYQACREHDRAVVWMRRLWRYFADRLDQRRSDAAERALLRAADEVAWSCHRGVMQRAAMRLANVVPTPAPLPFLSPDYSPAAIEAGRPLPSELQIAVEVPAIGSYLAGLPLSQLRLPPWCLDAPWWLVFVGHEVGHQLMADLKLGAMLAQRLGAAANGVAAGAAERWQGWAEETFADVVSLVLMGPVALWAMAELEWAPAARMLRSSARYPAPAVRLELMARCAGRLGLAAPPPDLRAQLDAVIGASSLPAPVTDDLAVLPAALDVLLGPLVQTPNGQGLGIAELAGFDARLFGSGSDVAAWTAAFARVDGSVQVDPGLDRPRLVAAAAAAAWWSIRDDADDARREARRQSLRTRLLATLPACGPPGVRARGLPDGHQPALGSRLAEDWLAAARAHDDEEGAADGAVARPR